MGGHKEALLNISLADQMLHSFTLQYITSCGELLKGGQSCFLKALVSKNVAGKREGINPVKLLMFNQNNYIPAVSSLLNSHILGTVKQMWAMFNSFTFNYN